MRQLPEDEFIFVKRHIDSVEMLEVLFLVFRNPERGWTTDSISQEIRTSRSSIQNRLASLVSSGLLVSIPTSDGALIKFQPVTQELHDQVVKLEQNYKIRRMSVIDAIYAPPAEEKMLNFLDAFKIRKNEKDE